MTLLLDAVVLLLALDVIDRMHPSVPPATPKPVKKVEWKLPKQPWWARQQWTEFHPFGSPVGKFSASAPPDLGLVRPLC